MGYKNFGFAKAIVSNKLGGEFLNEGEVKSKDLAGKLLDVIKESRLLQKEFKIFENIENKYIPNDVLATRYIDENINTFLEFTQAEIISEHNKLEPFIDESFLDLDPKKRKLYEALDTLLYESANEIGDPNIDLLHESFEIVLDYVKTNKPVVESDSFVLLDEHIDLDEVVKISIDKFNKKFSSLNEDQRKILNQLVFGKKEEMKPLFESLKTENLQLLSELDKNGIEDKINETISRIEKMEYNDSSLVKDVVSLCDLKSSLS